MSASILFYKHSQAGTPARVLLGGMAALFSLVPMLLPGMASWLSWGFGLLGVVFWVLLLLFHSLRVWVNQKEVELSFGVGLVRKTFPLSEITSAKRVQTSGLDGWGIHLTRRGWLYNASGFDAIELGLGAHRRVLIGTDDPEGLLEALKKAKPSICIAAEN
ncbi:MAG TPA: hypothetical protein ENK02_01455 [Planctomycetes bacterium]|nr:hypothetical protein [Planctomycetota bacterium]